MSIAITFSGCVENHHGMEMIGEIETRGLNLEELETIASDFVDTELININVETNVENLPIEAAYLLVIRNGVNQIGEINNYFKQLKKLNFDKKAFMRGRVVNKHARWNLCFADFDQEPDYANGKGRVVNFNKVPELQIIREYFEPYISNITPVLYAEANYYYDTDKTYIGFHGDTERRIVICARFGETMTLRYRCYRWSKQVGDEFSIEINDNDIYIMSDKTTGYDWRKSSLYTFRHAAGNLDLLK